MYLNWLFFVSIFLVCSAKVSRKELGYAKGFIGDCPGSTKPAIIPKRHLRDMGFVIQKRGYPLKRYNYYNIEELAKDPRIDFNKRTIVLVSGYLDSILTGILIFSPEYEDRDYNIIMLDVGRWMSVHYFLTSRLTRPLGLHAAEALIKLLPYGLQPSKVELLGMSMGGHIIAFIAKYYQKLTGTKLARVTGIEPSGPCFRYLGTDDRLGPDDADFVEVLHTNIDTYGMPARMGHMDIYINGGEYQPSELTLYPCTQLCSHGFAALTWIMSLHHPKKFIAIKCDSIQQARDHNCYERKPLDTNYVGLEANQTNHGIFYLATDVNLPYFLGENGLKREYNVWNKINEKTPNNETKIYT